MEINRETYLETLRIASLNLDWKMFGLTVASINPELFVEVANTMEGNDWKKLADENVRNGFSKVDSIKFVKEKSGMSLLESKTWVEDNLFFGDSQ